MMFSDGGMREARPRLTTHPQQLKYGDKTHVLQSSPESHRCELYRASGPGSDDDDLEFAALIHHSLTALQQLRSSMAAISEFKEANKYASPVFPRLSRDLLSCSAPS
jgi:hypothetical protein